MGAVVGMSVGFDVGAIVGIRVGTPAATTRGFSESDCRDLATWICDICDDIENPAIIDEVRVKVEALCAQHPVYK